MYTLRLAVGLVAAGMVVAAGSARAADLNYGPIPDRYSSAYEDPRYRDLYGPEPRYRHEERYYQPTPPPPPPRAYSYKDDPDERPPLREFNHYDRVPPPDYRQGQACVPRGEIRRALIEEGWREFRDLELRGDVALVRARRPNGDLYDLKVDRCSGEVLKARLIERNAPGPYAYGPYAPAPHAPGPYAWGPRRWDRPYH